MKTDGSHASPYRVVIVDDDVTERDILVELLSSPSRCVEAFDSAESALEFLRENPVDLAFLDHIIPGMSGADLAAKIKELHPQARIVMCTGYLVEVGYPRLCEQAERVLHKPLNLGEVLQLADAPPGGVNVLRQFIFGGPALRVGRAAYCTGRAESRARGRSVAADSFVTISAPQAGGRLFESPNAIKVGTSSDRERFLLPACARGG